MKLTILDFQSKRQEVEIGELKDIQRITIKVISGDEIAVVLYKDYKITEFDFSGCRLIGFSGWRV